MADAKVTELAALTAAASDDLLPIVDVSAGATKKITVENLKGYKSYVALLSQSGTDAPVATVLENTLGGTVVWARGSAGGYSATLAGAFPGGRTFLPPRSVASNNADAGINIITSRVTDDVVSVSVSTFPDGNSSDMEVADYPFEIRVYPA